VKKERFDSIMKLQRDINFNKNKKLIGSSQKVLVDTVLPSGESIGRTFRDSPQIDNTVKFKTTLKVGSFYNSKIISATDYDLVAEVSS